MKRWRNFEWLDTVDRKLFAIFFNSISGNPIAHLEKCDALELKNLYYQYIQRFPLGNELEQKNKSNQIYRGYKNYEKKQKNIEKKQSAINVELSNQILKKLDKYRASGDKELSRSEFISMLISSCKVKDVKNQRIDKEAISTSDLQGGIMKNNTHSVAPIPQNQTLTPVYRLVNYPDNQNNNNLAIDSIIRQLEQLKSQ